MLGESGGIGQEEVSTATTDFASLPEAETITIRKNANNNSDSAKAKSGVNIRFVIAIILFLIGLILCVVAAVLTMEIWKHSRGGSSKPPLLQAMKFPGKSKHTTDAMEKWAQKFNDIRALNSHAEGKIPRVADEVCLTFEKYPGLFNKHIEAGDIEGEQIKEVQIYYFNFFAMYFFSMAAALMFFVIMFVISEHLMILKGGDSFDSLTKCSLMTSLICSIFAIIACVLLAVGLSEIHPEFLTKILTQTCKYNMSSSTYAALAPGAVAAAFFLIGAPLSFVMYKD